MRKTILLILLLMGSAIASLAQTLPVTGTFINLPYQDVRNKYTNHDAFVDQAIFRGIPAGLKKMKVTFTVEKESYIYIIGK